ncbi:glycosyltransferase [Autumnicola edwardsiae]|uniref:Glycosyltransferase n=1 Tax=Autumnicola edwardsiae TaxID=3075594 RepID=A0ABU3CQ99_9FLAO|nr:glycosyltransferase [Zunongwangia sp. F297]MDT0648532.1 glycosyltransferase [Zunongwangia sp. F297]
MRKKRILVAPLNWGLGHASRCVPIIKSLEQENFEPVLASDGNALLLLKKEFSHLESFELPSYKVEYARNGSNFKWKMMWDSPKILKAIKAEKKATKKLVEELNLEGIISDNRFGVRYKHLKCVFITHQLNVLSGTTTYFSSKLHQKYIKKFDKCWIPDAKGGKNLSGILGHLNKVNEYIKYIGPLSRFEKKELPKKYDYLILLSGPEPQRTILEELLLKEFSGCTAKILLIRGVVEENDRPSKKANIGIENYMFGKNLEDAVNSSEVVICRSGYTSILDLAKLEKKAFFIPTPGQFEQEYLAERLMNLGIAPSCKQSDFKLSKLKEIDKYKGLKDIGFATNFREFFALF